MEMFTCKPMNYDCCVDVRKDKNDPRSNMIKEAYDRGVRMRLDAEGVRLAMNHNIVPIKCIAIDRRNNQRW